ncbi:MAG: hypothetical protein ACO23R_02735 [bacterium]
MLKGDNLRHYMTIPVELLKIEEDSIFCDQRMMANILGLKAPAVSQLQTDGVFQPVSRGRYDIFDVIQKYVQYLRKKSDARSSGSGSADFHEEKARLTKAQADMAEMEAEEMSGSMVRVEEVLRVWQEILMAMKGKLLSVPSKAATLVADEDNPAQCKEILELMVREALNELSEYGEKHNGSFGSGDESPETSSETDSF